MCFNLHPQLEKDLYLIVQLETGFAPHRYNLKISLMQIFEELNSIKVQNRIRKPLMHTWSDLMVVIKQAERSYHFPCSQFTSGLKITILFPFYKVKGLQLDQENNPSSLL